MTSAGLRSCPDYNLWDKRLAEMLDGLFGLRISEGAIANMLARTAKPFAECAEKIAATVRNSPVIASDETSARVKGKTYWQWTFVAATAVAHLMAPTRGKIVPKGFLHGARPKVWISDRLPARCNHAEQHQFCLAAQETRSARETFIGMADQPPV